MNLPPWVELIAPVTIVAVGAVLVGLGIALDLGWLW